ncbi:hypothetical protein GJ744_011711 [Endocarpon pusillum]|uniref:Uncharacterized protein n=1 Tax=Endocarpon pusillum TaxID=364733 RepID=A0A8H7AG24_9EURO|nr:hypothetical protein GJ744_011711 [Endocarpon pusillum]
MELDNGDMQPVAQQVLSYLASLSTLRKDQDIRPERCHALSFTWQAREVAACSCHALQYLRFDRTRRQC